jgi:hypothetical protein
LRLLETPLRDDREERTLRVLLFDDRSVVDASAAPPQEQLCAKPGSRTARRAQFVLGESGVDPTLPTPAFRAVERPAALARS